MQVGESHVNGHRSDHAAATETDGPGPPRLQRHLITTSGNTHTHKYVRKSKMIVVTVDKEESLFED